MNEKERGDTKDHPLSHWFLNFSEADELLKLAAARQQVSMSGFQLTCSTNLQVFMIMLTVIPVVGIVMLVSKNIVPCLISQMEQWLSSLSILLLVYPF